MRITLLKDHFWVHCEKGDRVGGWQHSRQRKGKQDAAITQLLGNIVVQILQSENIFEWEILR